MDCGFWDVENVSEAVIRVDKKDLRQERFLQHVCFEVCIDSSECQCDLCSFLEYCSVISTA